MPAIRPDRIRKLREELGLTQDEVAREAQCNQGHYSAIERGLIPSVGARILIGLARALRTNVDYLTGTSDDPTPNKRLEQRDLTQDEEDLLLAYRRLRSEAQKRLAHRLIQALLATDEAEDQIA